MGDEKSVRILNRVVTYTDDGIEWEADQRHAEIIVKQMGLGAGSKGVITPGIQVKFIEGADELRELPSEEASKFRGLVARANYLSQDRGDIKFAVKELSRRMAKPRFRDVEALKRLARYLVGKPRMISNFKRQEKHNGIVGWSDPDWQGMRRDKKINQRGIVVPRETHSEMLECHSISASFVIRGG